LELDIHKVLVDLLLILILGRFFAEISYKLKAPPVVGEVLAGLILGPSLLNIVHPNQIIKLFAEIGIILLLFEVGFEADIKKLKNEGFNSFIVAFFGAAFPFIIGTLVSYYFFEFNILTSLFIGGTLTATSIGISLRVLKDLGLHLTKMASIVIGAAVLDDILGVIVLAALAQIATLGNLDLFELFKLIILMTLFLIISPIIAAIIVKVLHLFEKNHIQVPGYISVVVVAFILFFSILAHLSGLPPIIGAFVAGIALSKRFAIPIIDLTEKSIKFKIKSKENKIKR